MTPSNDVSSGGVSRDTCRSGLDPAQRYAASYFSKLTEACSRLDLKAIASAAALIKAAIDSGRTIFCCGNGGSAAISNHLLCDFAKGIQTDTNLRPKVVSLASHSELLSAIANDIDFKEVFAFQLRSWARPGDLLIAISSSGNSENIVRAIASAKELGLRSVAMTGFDGGRARDMADVCIHTSETNYGVVEDTHQALMHLLAQFLREQALISEPTSL